MFNFRNNFDKKFDKKCIFVSITHQGFMTEGGLGGGASFFDFFLGGAWLTGGIPAPHSRENPAHCVYPYRSVCQFIGLKVNRLGMCY